MLGSVAVESRPDGTMKRRLRGLVHVELDIHEKIAPRNLKRFAPHYSNFQPVYLSRSLMMTPNRRSKRTLPALPAFKIGSPFPD
ncbi:hypothetical protein AVEN_121178-1 [Araneus ventricosus]|uniref:Uncharacterized protein n=1 Tax=Araneus ventricosus TaxID=182803 RepID=A0A4Y2KK02_ARAVE|nr:hypothetical protein AVEN_121178-1 [Araneus ventricosus]